MLKPYFHTTLFSYISKKANKVPHCLVDFVFVIGVEYVWIEAFSPQNVIVLEWWKYVQVLAFALKNDNFLYLSNYIY